MLLKVFYHGQSQFVLIWIHIQLQNRSIRIKKHESDASNDSNLSRVDKCLI